MDETILQELVEAFYEAMEADNQQRVAVGQNQRRHAWELLGEAMERRGLAVARK